MLGNCSICKFYQKKCVNKESQFFDENFDTPKQAVCSKFMPKCYSEHMADCVEKFCLDCQFWEGT